jgi:hypothetical protein
MNGFRNSDDFQEWRRLVSPYFDGAPKVTHSEGVALLREGGQER